MSKLETVYLDGEGPFIVTECEPIKWDSCGSNPLEDIECFRREMMKKGWVDIERAAALLRGDIERAAMEIKKIKKITLGGYPFKISSDAETNVSTEVNTDRYCGNCTYYSLLNQTCRKSTHMGTKEPNTPCTCGKFKKPGKE
jgi:hypothetical protein